MKINFKYVIAFIILFLVELLIGIYVHDQFIRPYLGDVIVVIAVYCFVRIFISKHIKLLPLYVFIFSVIVEFSQYLKLVKLLHLEGSRFLSALLGSSFDVKDIICYFVGTMLLFLWQGITKRLA